MRVRVSSHDLKTLLASDQIPLEAAIRIFHESSNRFDEEVGYGNSLLKDAGTHLSPWTLRRLIRAEISNDIALEEVRKNRILLNRLCTLFPEIVRRLRITNSERAKITFNIVYDSCYDYRSTLGSGRQEANRKKLIQKMDHLKRRASELSTLLDDDATTRSFSFESAQRLIMKRVYGKVGETRPVWRLQQDIKLLSWHLELEIYRARRKPRSVSVPDNQAKTHLVDAVYGLALSEGYPPFVTTPGSEFSYLCSLLFEIATGKPDESLAGAINRYARSNERAEADQHEVDYGEERARARDEDNFYDIKNSTYGSDEDIAELLSEVRDPAQSAQARLLVMCELQEMVEAIENRDRIHGPFVMWADQIKSDWGEKIRALDADALEELRRDIKAGKERRSKLQST